MEIICSKESLIKSLGIAESVISTRNNISVLSNVLLETTNDLKLKISAFDVTLNFISEINCDIIKEGKIGVNCNRLYSIVKKLECDEIEIKVNENNEVTILPKREFKTSKYMLKGIDNNKFSPISIPENINYFSMKQDIFQRMIKRTIFAVSDSDNRRFISGILFEKNDKNLRMVATDGKRLALINKDIVIDDIDNCNVIVPPKILQEVTKLCGNSGDLIISISNQSIIIKIENFIFISNLLEGTFPPYSKVIPQEQPNKFTINKKELYNSIDRISLLGDKESHKIILSLKQDTLTINTYNLTFGSGEEILNIEYGGEPIDIALNYTFITDFLTVVEREKVVFEFKNSESTITVKEEDNVDYIYVMMPMSLS